MTAGGRLQACVMMALVGGVVAACEPPSGAEMPASGDLAYPQPTSAAPMQGLPALSSDRLTIALPTWTSDGKEQSRSIAFLRLGDNDVADSDAIVEVPKIVLSEWLEELEQRYRDHRFHSLTWSDSGDNVKLPVTLAIEDLELVFTGDAKARVDVAVKRAGQQRASDVYLVEGETATSAEHVYRLGVTSVTKDGQTFVYVRFDIDDGHGTDSDWRVLALDGAKS